MGVMRVPDAVRKAKEADLTLVEIAPNATPPVAKIVDFGKFRYSEEKKLRETAKKVKGGGVKEIRFSPFIAENDFKTRIGRIKEFFEDKNKVRIVVVFRGPQMRVKNTGYDVIKRILTEFGESVITDMPPKFLGKHLVTVLSFVKLGKKVQEQKLKVVSESDESNHGKS